MKALSKLKIGFIILAASLVLFLLAFFYYKSESGQIIKDKHEFLDAVTKIKLEQIVEWRNKRISEAKFFPIIGNIIKHTVALNENKSNKAAKKYFSNALLQFKTNGYFQNVFITGVNGSILFSLDSSINTIDQVRIEEIKSAVEKDSAIIGDFYFCETHKTIHFNVVSVIKDNTGIPIGAYVQIVDPYKSLYPIIQSWPVSSKTAETLLFKKEDDHVVYLNELRHKKNSALSLKIGLTESDIVAVKAVLGARGIIEGKDYRGKDVLAAVKKVPDTDWFMVSKVDKDELYSELFYRASVISLIALITILLISFAAFYIHKFQQSNIYKNLFLKEKELAETQEEYKTTLYSIGDAVITTDTQGKIKQMNSVAETLTGWKEIEVKGKSLTSIFKVINEETNLPVENPVNRVLRDGVVVGLANHTILISKRGDKIPIADSGSPIKNSEGNITGVVLVFRDQSEEREKEKALYESNEKFLKLFRHSADSISLTQLSTGKLSEINEGFEKIFGYSRSEAIGKTTFELGLWANPGDRVNMFELLKQNGFIKNFEASGIQKNGNQITALISGELLEFNNEPYLLLSLKDISERKIAEEKIKNSEANLNSLINNSNESIWSIDKDYNYIVFNNFFTEAYFAAYHQKLVKGVNALNILAPELKAFWKPKYDVALSGERIDFEFSIDLGNEIKFFHVFLNPIKSDGIITGVSALSVDITERKRIEETLIRIHKAVECTSDAIGFADAQGRHFYQNKAFTDLFEYKTEEINATGGEPVGYVDSSVAREVFVTIMNGGSWNGEVEMKSKSGRKFPVQMRADAIRDEDGRVIGLVGVHTDITERKKAEDSLRKSETFLNTIIEYSPYSMWISDNEGTLIRMNQACRDLLRVTDEVLVGKYNILNDNIVEEQGAMPLVRRVFENGERVRFTLSYDSSKLHPMRLAETVLRILQVTISPVFDEQRRVIHAIIQHEDITEQKHAEAELLKLSQKDEEALRIANMGHWEFDVATGNFLFNNQYYSLHGTTSDDAGGYVMSAKKFASQYVYPDDAFMVSNSIQQAIETDDPHYQFQTEARILRANGEPRDVTVWFRVEKDAQGKTTKLYGVNQDITERKKADALLRENEERWQFALEGAGDGVWDWNPQTNEVFFSTRWKAMLGFEEHEIKNTIDEWEKRIHPDDKIQVYADINKHFLGQTSVYVNEHRVLCKNGTYKWILDRGKVVRWGQDKKPLRMVGTHADLTESKRADQALRESEFFLRKSQEVGDLGSYYFDVRTGMWISSEKLDHIFGIDDTFPKTVSGWIDLVHPDNKEMMVDHLTNHVITQHNRFDKEYRIIRHNDGQERWMHGLGELEFDADGNTIKMIGTIQDITIRKRAEEALAKSEERLRLSLKAANQGLYDLNIQTGEAIVNDEYATMLGYDPKTFKETNAFWIERLHPEDRESTAKAYLDYIEGITSEYRVEFRQKTKDNKWKWILSLGKTVEYDSNGNPLRMLGTHTDVTKQKNIEKNITRLSRAVEQSPVIIMITNIEGEIEYVNPKFTEVTGYTFDEVIGKNPRFLKSGHNTPEEYRILWETITKHKEWRGEFFNRKKNGELYWESAFISPLINEQGQVTNYIAVKEDITERKKIISDLIEAKTKADEMNRVKAYFFANMSHELRTPFVGIMGFSEMLIESLNNPAEKEMAEQILKSSKRLTETLNKILNVTRLEFDKVDVKISDVDIVELIKQLTTLFSKSGTIKNTVIGSTCSPDIIRVRTDGKLLEEILTNLLNNAIKYTENGAIEIIVRNTVNEKGDRLIIKVADTGIGIPKDKQEIIWQEFRQVSEGMNRSFEGTGLGLTIIKKYVNTLGGQISLESEAGRGSTFTIELPVKNLEDKEMKVPQLKASKEPRVSDALKGRKPKILYVEDDVIALSYVDKVLRSQYEIDTAFNSAIALDLANKNKYEVVLLDINLGRGIDGVELMQIMRKIDGYVHIPMVAVTAYAADSDRLDFLAKGFTHYLSKPFTSVELKATLSRIFN